MTYCNVSKSTLSGVITCPSSKSYTHRAIFLSALAYKKGSTITNMLRSEDTDATINACKKFGATFEFKENSMHVTNVIQASNTKSSKYQNVNDEKTSTNTTDENYRDYDEKDTIMIDAANSGTTIRIATGIASLLDTCVTLTGDSSLKTRPMRPLLDALSNMGAICKSTGDGRPPLEICGPPISGGNTEIPGNISSQFITSLFLCAPRTSSGISITITDNMVSKPYLDATIGVMREFGVSVNTQIPYKKYHIAPQRIIPATNFTVPFDASSLALLLAASALNDGNIIINAHMGTLPQGDEVFIDMLESMGARIEISDSIANDEKNNNLHNSNNTKKLESEMIQVHTGNNMLSGGKFDLSNNPDLLPPLAIMALKCKNPIEINNVEHARLKETDRISILARELAKMGIKVTERKDGMNLDGSDIISNITETGQSTSQKNTTSEIVINSENDHRLFMALCIAGMYVGNYKITNPDSVAVSYPKFIEDIKSLGAKIKIA